MRIKSLKVEEGFFNDLDLKFTEGLNVLVGGRGVGKTTAIELLRFGLGAKSLGDYPTHSDSIAISILKSTGRVSIDLELENGEIFTVSRAAQDSYPIQNGVITPPIIFSQTEIEAIGLNKIGRLSLIDSFIDDCDKKYNEIQEDNKKIVTLCNSYYTIKKEVEQLVDQTSSLKKLEEKEVELLGKYESIQIKKMDLESVQENLNNAQNTVSKLSVILDNNKSIRNNYLNKIKRIAEVAEINKEIIDFFGDVNAKNFEYDFLKSKISKENDDLNSLLISNTEILNEIDLMSNYYSNEKREAESISRKLRAELESNIEGSGAILSELGRVREDIAKVKNLNEYIIFKKNNILDIYSQIQALMMIINEKKRELFRKRLNVVNDLNASLSPHVKVVLSEDTDFSDYFDALEFSLKGSGLKYKELLFLMAERVNPVWLLYYIESKKYEDFSKVLDIPIDRAARIISHLNDINLSKLLTSQKEDIAEFYLLDHGKYKPINELSIGQRCTVALSIIMENKKRILIIDQPEDHLDNEFIVNTLVKSIKRRSSSAQTILSSHNANIPVLGEAKNIINLESNGRRGYIKVSGEVNVEQVKRVIESLMEGGKEAFEYRSKFYKE